jgi:xanthine dehydrogenase YagT iron-sulfur-binding subunit
MGNQYPKRGDLSRDASSRGGESEDSSGVSRREFLKISGASAAAPLLAGSLLAGSLAGESLVSESLVCGSTILAAGEVVPVYGPGPLPMEFSINGKEYKANLEPRVTLLDALRDQFDLTGAKRVCDRGECGACTVLVDNRTVYACSLLAIEAQGRQILTVESLMQRSALHPIQQAFVDHDASQCGFCTPGFVVACKAVLDKNPKPTVDDIRRGLSGNFCRCGTYHGIQQAMAQLALTQKT